MGSWLVAPSEQKDRLRTLWNPAAGPANAQASAGGRWEGFVAAMQMLRDRPLTGVGVGNFVPYRVAYVDGVGLWLTTCRDRSWVKPAGSAASASRHSWPWLGETRSRLRAMSEEMFELAVYRQLAIALQMTLLLSFLFGLSLHNGLRYNWLWIAAFGCLACEFCQRDAQQLDSEAGMNEGFETDL